MIKNFFWKNKIAIGACVLISAFAVGYWVLSSPATTSIGEDINVGGRINVGGVNFPWRWTAAANTALDFAITTWTDVPGATISYTLPSAADVQVHYDGGIMASQLNIHCNLRFVMDGTPTGHITYGDQITMGEGGQHWQVVSRTRWFLNQTAGSHTVKIQGRSEPAAADAHQCTIANEDYSRLRLEVIAFPN